MPSDIPANSSRYARRNNETPKESARNSFKFGVFRIYAIPSLKSATNPDSRYSNISSYLSFIISSANRYPRKLIAFVAKAKVIPSDDIMTPPIAGPANWARLNMVALNPSAAGRSSGGTRLG